MALKILEGEFFLTVDIIAGLVLAEIIIRLRVADAIMRHFVPKNIPGVTALAVAVSAGSSKAGAAILSSALDKGELDERSALWSVLMLPLPSYLRRWPSTLALSVSMAGLAGGVFAVSLLVRSVLRFVIALKFLRRGIDTGPPCQGGMSVEDRQGGSEFDPSGPSGHLPFSGEVKRTRQGGVFKFVKKLSRTLPIAWLFFAAAYGLVPVVDELLRSLFPGNAAIWSIAAASIGHVTAALSMTGGALKSGQLSVAQAVFALILGSGLGTTTRILRQNAGYYYGFFPKRIATKMLVLNFATILPLIILNLLFAGLALSLWP